VAQNEKHLSNRIGNGILVHHVDVFIKLSYHSVMRSMLYSIVAAASQHQHEPHQRHYGHTAAAVLVPSRISAFSECE